MLPSLYLSRHLRRAQLMSTQGADAAFDLLATGKVEALAGLTPGLLGLAPKLPGSRGVEGRFMGVQQSIAVPKGRDAGLHYLRSVVEDAKTSGLVARAIDKTGAKRLRGAAREITRPARHARKDMRIRYRGHSRDLQPTRDTLGRAGR